MMNFHTVKNSIFHSLETSMVSKVDIRVEHFMKCGIKERNYCADRHLFNKNPIRKKTHPLLLVRATAVINNNTNPSAALQ